MHSMYAKLFSRIAQSSLMEQDVEVRYCFMMLLAIADPLGDVIGTDIAIARTVNLPLNVFQKCIKVLMEPDPDSNSQVHDGKRVIASENGRGYQLVNYVTYREIKTLEEKRSYMRDYMRKRRGGLKTKDITSVKPCKNVLSDVTHAESESESESEDKKKHLPRSGSFPTLEQAKAFAETVMVTPAEAEAYWLAREATDWQRGANGSVMPVGNWQADMRQYINGQRQREAEAKAKQAQKPKIRLVC